MWDIAEDKYMDVLHIEVGAGRGIFGQRFYPDCLLTDYDIELVTIHRVTTLDCICDAYALPWSDNRFDLVILCNPYPYGFREEEKGQALLKELTRVLRKNGKILIVGNDRNPYCTPTRLNKAIVAFNGLGTYILSKQLEEIDSIIEYPDYIFETCSFTPTIPNFRMTINVNK